MILCAVAEGEGVIDVTKRAASMGLAL